MARSCAASLTVFLCLLLLFGFSSARIPTDLPEFDDTTSNNNREYDSFSVSHPRPNPTAANKLFLPSENPDTEPSTLIHMEPETTDSQLSKPEPETVQSQLEESNESQSQVSSSDHESVPFTVINFRPINRHIPRRPLPLSYRLGHRCRHNHRFKPRDPLFPRRHIPYGNDMILNNGEDRSSDRMPRGGVHQIPPRWTRFQHVGPRFFRESDTERSEEIRRPYRHHHHHHHHNHYPMDQEGEHEEGGFMMRFRKFLNQF